ATTRWHRRRPWPPARPRSALSTSRIATSIRHLALDEAKLQTGERDHHQHQDHRLGRRAAEVAAQTTVEEHLVDQGFGGLGRAAAGGGIDDTEGVEEHVDDVDDEQKESGRRQQWEDDGPEPPD